MHRFYVGGPVRGVGETVTLSREESQHAMRVLRLKPGEEVRLLDGENLYGAELLQVTEQAVTAQVRSLLPSSEPPVEILLWQGLPKADKLEMIVQKATELGVKGILPVEMERSVARLEKGDKAQKKRERLQRIALEAAKQSGRAHVPTVLEARGFDEALNYLTEARPGFDAVLVAWEGEAALRLSEAVREAHGNTARERDVGVNPLRLALVIGPEGGISPGECRRLKALGGDCVTLGPRILRTETAGLCALAVTLTALGEM